MTTTPDVLVLGGGAAGIAAALAAARKGAQSVVVLKKGEGATTLSSGAVDVADAWFELVPGAGAASPLERGPRVREGVERLVSISPRHPYARVGVQGRARLDDALALLERAASGLRFAKNDDGRNLVVATQLGTVKRTALVQQSLAFDLASLAPGALVAVVELDEVAGFDAEPVRKMLSWITRLAGSAARFVTLRVPSSDARLAASPRALAATLDDAALARIARALKEVLAAGEKPALVVLPPLLGLDDAVAARARVEGEVGLPVVELLALPPSAPGQRLSAALLEGARRAGVVVRAASARSAVVERGRVVEVSARDAGRDVAFRPRSVVLATGRFLAGGLVRDGYASEPVFGLPVVSGGEVVGDRFIGALTGDRPAAAHAIFRAGVGYDERLRPKGEGGAVFAENLFAAGSVLEGYDPARDASGLGVCALTGLLAGEAAAEYALTRA